MNTPCSSAHLPTEWQQARLSRDARFDGVFYIGVLTTGIFCRPICPARLPKEDNVRYLRSPAEATQQGFRPCRRCRPEYSPTAAQQWPDERLDAALQAIENGFLDHYDVPSLARTVDLSDRQLRRLFQHNLGITPAHAGETRRLLLAKQLLCESNLPITEVALAAGFNSVRRFNSKIQSFYQQTPTDIRKARRHALTPMENTWVVDLPHSPHYPWQQVFRFYQQRAIEHLERAGDDFFQRVIVLDQQPLLLSCEKLPHRAALRLTVTGARPAQLSRLIALARKALDLNSNHLAIAEHLSHSRWLASRRTISGPIALPGAWDAFEYLIRAIVGQQVSVKAARTLTRRLLERCGEKVTFGEQSWYLFPTAGVLASADLSNMGMPRSRIDTLQNVARAQLNGDIELNITHSGLHPADALAALRHALLAIKGIGPWTADYLLMRGFYQPDIWLDTDLGIIHALKQRDPQLNKQSLRTIADDCAPWRSYAVLGLWQSLSGEQ
ncbi:DNA-3-methyladenine glycosylase 2 family protein [Aestuariicella hydrocarbonica]|uniref:DNA-3-methyladenine glycosylase II n=1 Tax=Pseudomaricurvus hydrocarbonicus TaxID=1470433 RepID=A0A9E5MMF0_9GAMM|nr:Ada metal-binding domain-containing protein [Aestuariicella hydrocarbonica]NHO66275.1 DNA-3-methyladenine glycosylase 2 family protein [Aestuariicella hydrocarbonica]